MQVLTAVVKHHLCRDDGRFRWRRCRTESSLGITFGYHRWTLGTWSCHHLLKSFLHSIYMTQVDHIKGGQIRVNYLRSNLDTYQHEFVYQTISVPQAGSLNVMATFTSSWVSHTGSDLSLQGWLRIRTGPVPGSGPDRSSPRLDQTGLGSFFGPAPVRAWVFTNYVRGGEGRAGLAGRKTTCVCVPAVTVGQINSPAAARCGGAWTNCQNKPLQPIIRTNITGQ